MFDAFGMTKKRSSSTHHTMMSSTTCASSGSSRCVYCASARRDLARSLVSSHCSAVERARAAALDGAEMRHVEHDTVFAARAVLLEHARVLQRHLPAAERHHARAESAVLRVERAVAHAVGIATRSRPPGLGRRDVVPVGPRSNGSGGPSAGASASASCDGGSSPYFTSRCR